MEGLHWTAQGSVRGLEGFGSEMVRLGGRFGSVVEGIRMGRGNAGRWARPAGAPLMRVGG